MATWDEERGRAVRSPKWQNACRRLKELIEREGVASAQACLDSARTWAANDRDKKAVLSRDQLTLMDALRGQPDE